ncbi:hypothetical protein [Gilvibacter sediminis]|uniref:hypothetical protein n=1 Tax=Gilvibacter sediminis TaxID=379071 RepID=UPI0023510142|nr:hypothetical protein [Gilvibacter sediminis]MDC7999273.1 hypothetical protein [Gilvibacter sediminis]
MRIIRRKKPLVAIVIALNDLETFHGGSRNGIKGEIGYFDQFLILYQSVKDNWRGKYFDHQFYLLHSIPFSEEKMAILRKTDVKVMQVEYPDHPTKIRPMCYRVDIACDYRLVLDVDMYALKEPKFNFKYDAQAAYGGNKYNKEQWSDICDYLNAKLPEEACIKKEPGSYTSWSYEEHNLYQLGKFKKRQFPYFNNGAILVSNDLSKNLVDTWEAYRRDYTLYVKDRFDHDIDQEGQDVMGLAIANVTSNWNHFPRGFNFVLQERFVIAKKLVHIFKGELTLLHYIQITEKNKFYGLIKDMHTFIRQQYYD